MKQPQVSLAYCFYNNGVQIAYYHEGLDEPELIGDGYPSGDGVIPMAMCCLYENGDWVIGHDAEEKGSAKHGFLIPDVFSVYIQKKPLVIDGNTYSADELFLLFLQKSLDLAANDVAPDQITDFGFTFPKLDGEFVTQLQSVLRQFLPDGQRIHIQDFEESFYDFVMHQKRDLRSNEVVYFAAREGRLHAWTLRQEGSIYGQPRIIEKTAFPKFQFRTKDQDMDEELAQLLERFLGKRLITAIFLSGREFEGTWMNRSLKVLCRGRRVFGVECVEVKGACYRAFRTQEGHGDKRVYYLGNHQIAHNIGLYILSGTGQEYCRMLNAGTDWYDAEESAVFLVDDCDQLTFLVDDVRDEKKSAKKAVSLKWLPERPNLATKICVELKYQDVGRCEVTVTDLGLGELYPSQKKSVKMLLTEES